MPAKVEAHRFFRRPIFIALLACILAVFGAHLAFYIALVLLAYQFQHRDHTRHEISKEFVVEDNKKRKDPYEGKDVDEVPPPIPTDPNQFKYPDREDGLWFARVFAAFWGEMEPYLSETTEASLKATLDWYRPNYIQDMYFETFTLGKRSPQLTKHAVYPTDMPKRVKWDFDLNFTSDAKITLRIKFGPQMLWLNVPVKVKRLMLATRVRLDLAFLGNYPYISVLGMSLLEKPRLDFVLKPMKTVDVMDMPGISKWLHSVAISSLEAAMMWPLVWEIPLEDWYGPPWDEYGNPVRDQEEPLEEGMERVVRIKIQAAKNLPSQSRIAYLEAKCGPAEYKTQKVPVGEFGGTSYFAETWEFALDPAYRDIRFDVYRQGTTGGWLVGTAQVHVGRDVKVIEETWVVTVPPVGYLPVAMPSLAAEDEDQEAAEVCYSIEVVTMPKHLIGGAQPKQQTKLKGMKKVGQKVLLNPMKKIGGGMVKGVIGVGKFALKPLKLGKKKKISLTEAPASAYFTEGQTLADLVVGWGSIEVTIMKARDLIAPPLLESESRSPQKSVYGDGEGGGGGEGKGEGDKKEGDGDEPSTPPAQRMKIDPLCTVSFARQEIVTTAIKDCSDPEWGEVHELIFVNSDLREPSDYVLEVSVKSKLPSPMTKRASGEEGGDETETVIDEINLGQCQIDISLLDDTPSLEWYPLSDGVGHRGDISVGVRYKPVERDPYEDVDSDVDGDAGSTAAGSTASSRTRTTSTAPREGARKGAVRDVDGVTSLLRVHVTGTREGKRLMKANRIYFIIELTVDQNSWTIDRRHKDFVSLDKKLRSAYPEKDLPTVPAIITVESQDRDDWQLLADYLLVLLKDPVIMKSGDKDMAAFLSPGVYKENTGKN